MSVVRRAARSEPQKGRTVIKHRALHSIHFRSGQQIDPKEARNTARGQTSCASRRRRLPARGVAPAAAVEVAPAVTVTRLGAATGLGTTRCSVSLAAGRLTVLQIQQRRGDGRH